jgi:hypothetical protein
MLARRWRGASAVAAGTMCVLTGLAGAASGDLDPTFGDRGLVVLSPAVDSYALAAALQADGKLVLAGSPTTCSRRHRPRPCRARRTATS